MRNPDERPATKHDLDQLEARLVEKMRDMRTEVLGICNNWTKPMEIRLRSQEERLTLLEARISEIELGSALVLRMNRLVEANWKKPPQEPN